MRTLLAEPNVISVKGDMCEFDIVQEDGLGIGKIRKTTGFATNAPHEDCAERAQDSTDTFN